MIRRFSPSAKYVSRPRGGIDPWHRRFVFWGTALAVVMLTLSACADDNTDRRFANETPPTVNPNSISPTVTPTTVGETAEAGPTILSPEALIVSRGAASSFYVHSGSSVVAFSADGTSQKTVWKGKDEELRDVASSPNGDRAAILTKLKDEYDVVIVDGAGKTVQEIKQVQRLLASATPTPSTAAGRDQIDWAPQGSQLLVAFADGGIVRLPLNGQPDVILDTAKVPGPIDAEWSPAGNAIAYIDRDNATSPSHLFVVPTTGQNREPIEIYPPTDSRSISAVSATWLPNASAILFTRTDPEDELPQGGDLFEVPAKGGSAKLVASSGRAAPVAAIQHFVASPNGRSVAYTVLVPGTQEPEFHSLWVQQLGTNQATKISTPPDETVTDVWFVSDGIAYRTTPAEPKKGEENSVAVYIVGADQTRRQVYATGSLIPGTPEASPVTSPIASPFPSPVILTPTANNPTPTPRG
jgi:hypothetical protein